MSRGGRTRRAGLALIAAGALLVAVSTFLAWIEFREFRIHLWDLTSNESVVIAASAFTAVALAGLGLARGGRALPAIVAAAVLAGVTLAIVEDWRDMPSRFRGPGDIVATAGAFVTLAGVALVVGAAPGARGRLLRGGLALAVFGLAVVFGQNALQQIHPEIQVVR